MSDQPFFFFPGFPWKVTWPDLSIHWCWVTLNIIKYDPELLWSRICLSSQRINKLRDSSVTGARVLLVHLYLFYPCKRFINRAYSAVRGAHVTLWILWILTEWKQALHGNLFTVRGGKMNKMGIVVTLLRRWSALWRTTRCPVNGSIANAALN